MTHPRFRTALTKGLGASVLGAASLALSLLAPQSAYG